MGLQSHDEPQIELKLLHRMSWVSLLMKSPYNALRFVLTHHICSFNYLCLFEFIFLFNMRDNKSWSLTFVLFGGS